MIIAFYPGSGGNRYVLSLQQPMVFESNQSYDHLLKSQSFVYRYLDSYTIGLNDQDLILTHCMNVPLLKKHFPAQTEIVVILSNFESSLKREFYLEDQYRDKNMNDKIEHAMAHFGFHCRYYKQYPVDLHGASQVIDIETDAGSFAEMMQKEINHVTCNPYDQAIALHNKLQPQDHFALPGDKIVNGFKSKFLDDAEKMRLELDKYSPSLCLAKWKQVSLHLTTGLNNSCYHPPLHRIGIDEIAKSPTALHNTLHKKQQRKMMLDGKRPKECSYCWAMEDNGKLSDRHYRSGEPWAAKDFGKIVSAEWTDDINPSYVEVNFNHACNLSCSYCSPQFSSTWQAEVDRLGGYPTSTIHNDPTHFTGNNKPIPARNHNPYVEAFWQWWPELYPELEHFRMTGGEPLMDKNTYRVFDYVLDNPNPKLHLNVTSNFSVETQLFDKYMKYVKQLCDGRIEHFMQYVSLDGFGPQAEYIRHGMSFDLVWARVDEYLLTVPNHNSLTFIITMNNLSVTSLQQLMIGILELRKKHSTTYQRVWFDTPVLREPAWQSLQILPESYVQVLERVKDFMQQNIETESIRFHGFKDYEIQRLDRDIAWMRNGQSMTQPDLNNKKADFYRFFNEHDQRRGTNFLKTFPEMQAWWKECEYHAQ
jgi:organic radical activating enzyme